jgi:hypothetical protein
MFSLSINILAWSINGTISLINTTSFINILIELKLLVLIELITHLLIHLLTY